MSQPPIVPGDDPYEPYQRPVSPPQDPAGLYPPAQYAPQQQPIPVYQVGRSDVVGKSVVGTVTVVVTLFLLFCVLPMFLCVGCGALGNIMNPPP